MFFLHVSPSDEYRWFFATIFPAFFPSEFHVTELAARSGLRGHAGGSLPSRSRMSPSWHPATWCSSAGGRKTSRGDATRGGRLSERVCLCWGACDYDYKWWASSGWAASLKYGLKMLKMKKHYQLPISSPLDKENRCIVLGIMLSPTMLPWQGDSSYIRN